jgi:hypothetical protein
MTPELQQRLYDRFPDVFADRTLSMTQTCMCWGIMCGDGWFQLIWDLCETFENLGARVRAIEVKEKYGTLRFYHYGLPSRRSWLVRAMRWLLRLRAWSRDDCERQEWASGAVRGAEVTSGLICEACGRSGRHVVHAGWHSTLCEECDRARYPA